MFDKDDGIIESSFVKDDDIIESSFVKVAPCIQGPLDIHYVKRYFNSNGVWFLEFSRLSKNLEPFYVQYCSRTNTLVYDHTGSESNGNECVFCKEFYHEDETCFQTVSSEERVEPCFFVTFNIIISHICPENFI